ncbi:FHA domain-containing protein [Teredinibacter haidensis]|uniref:FHA domain-containing protein n=1 Tax=Teredinibacter haidensis TaxID=2731755 RepID=UPI00094901F3|nr:FHA domain-containing protein [Teredinibacter haidensis]
MAFLRHLVNGNTISVYELTEPCLLGRGVDCPIRVDDPTVSAQHAKIDLVNGQWTVIDLDSTNGVSCNGERVSKLPLEPGTVLALGTHEFEFHENLPDELARTLKIKKSWIPGVYYTE